MHVFNYAIELEFSRKEMAELPSKLYDTQWDMGWKYIWLMLVT